MSDPPERARITRPELVRHRSKSADADASKSMAAPLEFDLTSILRAADRTAGSLPQTRRTSAAISLQRTLGNARTASLLAPSFQPGTATTVLNHREALSYAGQKPVQDFPAVQRGIFDMIKEAFGPKKIDAKGADKLIRKYFEKDLPEATKKNAKAEGHVNIVGESEFKAAYKRVMGEIDDDYELTNAFVDRSTDPPTVWGHKARINPTTVLHEGMHFYSNLAWKNDCGFSANEGVTEYFTRQTVAKEKLTERSNYEDEVGEVTALSNIVGDATMREGYFNGNVDGVKNALDKTAGTGAFEKWKQAMKNKKWAEARAALTKGS